MKPLGHFLLSVLSLACLCTGLCLTACQSGSLNQPTTSQSQGNSSPISDSSEPLDAVKEIVRIQAAPAPPGVEPEVFEALKAALISSLRTTSSGKLANIAPTGGDNVVKDLFLLEDGGQFSLEWSYLNNGDTDRNTEVNISDLTPIGVHYNARIGDPDWMTAKVADCDGNGEVNISDVTKLGLHYLSQCNGYNIYGSDSTEGPWTQVGSKSYGLGGNPPVPVGPGGHELASDAVSYTHLTLPTNREV